MKKRIFCLSAVAEISRGNFLSYLSFSPVRECSKESKDFIVKVISRLTVRQITLKTKV